LRSFLRQVLDLGLELSGQLLVLIGEFSDSIQGNPVIPSVLPPFVMDLILVTLTAVGGLDL
jgi:hypothetical protein